MNNKTKKMIKDYEAAVNAIAVEFLNKQIDDDEESPITSISGDYYWAGDDIGGVLCIADTYFYSFADILTDTKEDAPVGELDKYNNYCIRCIDLGLEPKINYHAWLHGAPHTPDETLDHLEKMKADFAAEIEKAKNMEQRKDEYNKDINQNINYDYGGD